MRNKLDEFGKRFYEDGQHRTEKQEKKVTKGIRKKLNLYKTEMCRSYTELGFCKYGGRCQFCHTESELRSINRHPKYKTVICRTYWIEGSCPYGKRCCFAHQEKNDLSNMTNDNLELLKLGICTTEITQNKITENNNIKLGQGMIKNGTLEKQLNIETRKQESAKTAIELVSCSSQLDKDEKNKVKDRYLKIKKSKPSHIAVNYKYFTNVLNIIDKKMEMAQKYQETTKEIKWLKFKPQNEFIPQTEFIPQEEFIVENAEYRPIWLSSTCRIWNSSILHSLPM